MSAATADAGAAPPKGKKKLIIIIAAVVVLALVGVGALLMMKKSSHADEEDGAEAPVKKVAKAHDPKSPPVFAPLEPFTVNLADKEAERYAQVGITLQLDSSQTADALKIYMPAIRNNILMLLAHKTSADLLGRDGKDKLAREVARETSRGLGVEIDEEAADDEAEDEKPSKKKKKAKKVEQSLPVTAVYFSTFIIQ